IQFAQQYIQMDQLIEIDLTEIHCPYLIKQEARILPFTEKIVVAVLVTPMNISSMTAGSSLYDRHKKTGGFLRPFSLTKDRPKPVLTSLRCLRTGSWCCLYRKPSEQLHQQSIPCGCHRCRSQPCSGASRKRCLDGSLDAERPSRKPACLGRRSSLLPGCR